MLMKSCASPGVMVPFKKASCIAKSALFGGPRALLKRSTSCSRICRDEKSGRGLSRRSFIVRLSSVLASVLSPLKRTQQKYVKIYYKKLNKNKHCTHKQLLLTYGTVHFFRHGYFNPHPRRRLPAYWCNLSTFTYTRTRMRAITAIFLPSCVRAHMQAMRLKACSALTRAPVIPVAFGPCFSSFVEPCEYVRRFAASPAKGAPDCALCPCLGATASPVSSWVVENRAALGGLRIALNSRPFTIDQIRYQQY